MIDQHLALGACPNPPPPQPQIAPPGPPPKTEGEGYTTGDKIGGVFTVIFLNSLPTNSNKQFGSDENCSTANKKPIVNACTLIGLVP